jgi:hypothetical protein
VQASPALEHHVLIRTGRLARDVLKDQDRRAVAHSGRS